MQDRENAIRTRAHQLWEQDGSTDGGHEKHWFQAEREINEGSPVLQTEDATPSDVPTKSEQTTPGAPEHLHPGSISDEASGDADKSGRVSGPSSKAARTTK